MEPEMILQQLGKTELIHSELAELGAKHLMERIEKGELCMEVMPNTFSQFTGEIEEADYISYCEFMESVKGTRLIALLEEADAEQFC